jgi:hypothetical protein
MKEDLEEKLARIKPVMSSVLVALEGTATEVQFREEFFNQEGSSFDEFLTSFGTNLTFYEFAKSIPDVCKVYRIARNKVLIERVSSSGTDHLKEPKEDQK